MNAQFIRQRMSGDRRRGSLENLVRTRVNGGTGLPFSKQPILQSWERQLSVVGPLNDDDSVLGFDREWVYKTTGSFSVSAPWMWAIVPTEEDIEAWDQVFNFNPKYEIKMRPMRWRIGADRDRVDPAPGVFLQQYPGGIAEERKFFSLVASPWVPGDNTTPPTDTGIDIASSTISFMPPFWEPGDSNNGSRVDYARVWINGDDVTGIVTLNAAATVTVNSLGSYYPIGRGGAFFRAVSLTLPVPIPKDATIEIDLWYKLSLARHHIETNWFTIINVHATTAWPGSVCESGSGFIGDHERTHTLKGVANMNASYAARGDYLFEFADQSVAGETSLTTNNIAWTKDATRWILFDATTQHTLTFVFGCETPFIILRKPMIVGGTGFLEAKYMCSGSSYDRTKRYEGTDPIDCLVGSFDPDASNLFFSVTNSVTHDPPSIPNYAQFPSSITVSRP